MKGNVSVSKFSAADPVLSATSANPVQNKVVYAALKKTYDDLDRKASYRFDSEHAGEQIINFKKSSSGYDIEAAEATEIPINFWRLTEIDDRIIGFHDENIEIGTSLAEAIENENGIYRVYELGECTNIELNSSGEKINYTFTLYEGTVYTTQGELQKIALTVESWGFIKIFKPTNTINAQSTEGEFASAKAVYRSINTAITERLQYRTGAYCYYYRTDIKYETDNLTICVKPISSRFMCIWIENSTIADNAIVEWFFTCGEKKYRFYAVKSSRYFWYGETPSTALSRGENAIDFSSTLPSAEFKFDLDGVTNLAQYGGITITCVNIYDESWNLTAGISLNLFCASGYSLGALNDAMRALAAATSVQDIAAAATAYISSIGG